ncbi:hypothetical protein EHS13_13885 [Paenibacillus psychroresistens]|uniref:Uncharacterized protein n=1 Tax=Paenibacillus psychroresistens TaxID=1778678 RepID=A0A6B8RKL1_9BACL|nr:hypothetical protein [Paenibacillus psychroresistens]QGQ95888.1 hypothetical protein EHS13_13885 [Paenibacillus psychroresistens]
MEFESNLKRVVSTIDREVIEVLHKYRDFVPNFTALLLYLHNYQLEKNYLQMEPDNLRKKFNCFSKTLKEAMRELSDYKDTYYSEHPVKRPSELEKIIFLLLRVNVRMWLDKCRLCQAQDAAKKLILEEYSYFLLGELQICDSNQNKFPKLNEFIQYLEDDNDL